MRSISLENKGWKNPKTFICFKCSLRIQLDYCFVFCWLHYFNFFMEYNLHMNSIIEFSNDCNELEKKGKKNKRDRIVIETRYQTRQQPRKGRCSSFFLIYFIFFSPFGGKRGPWVLNFLFARLRVDEIGRQRSSSVPSLSLSLSFSEEIPRPVNCLRSLGNKETNKTATQDSENVLHYDRLPVYHEFTGITKSPSLNLFFFHLPRCFSFSTKQITSSKRSRTLIEEIGFIIYFLVYRETKK